jgi:hypothetical protein
MMAYTFYFNGTFVTVYACTVFDAVRALSGIKSRAFADDAIITKVEAA